MRLGATDVMLVKAHALLARRLTVCVAAMAIAAFPEPVIAQSTPRGRVVDEQSQPIAGARVDLVSASPATVRTDNQGSFAFSAGASPPFRIQVRQIGYLPVDTVVSAGADVTIRLRRAVTRLSSVVVRGNWQGIHGIVADSLTLKPLAGAVLRVVGAHSNLRTDTLGAFAADLTQPGSYVVRVELPGYSPKAYTVHVGRDSARELLITLSESNRDDARTQILWREFDSRTRMRGLNSAVVTAEELAAIGTETASEALRRSRSFAIKNLKLQRDMCLYVNGEPKPGWTLDAFDVSEILAIEVYGRRGELTNTLAARWPRGVPCGPQTGASPIRLSESERRLQVQTVVLWLKKQ